MKNVVPKNSLHYGLVTYLTIDEITDVISKKESQISFCAVSPVHDKDTFEDEEGHVRLKEPHYHIALSLYNRRPLDSIRSWFKIDERNTLGKSVVSCKALYEYLTHKNDPSKVQYLEHDINVLKGSVDEYFTFKTDFELKDELNARAFDRAIDDDEERLLDDIIQGTSYRIMAKRYGRDFIKNYDSYSRYAFMLALEEGLPIDRFKESFQMSLSEARERAREKAIEESRSSAVLALRMILNGLHFPSSNVNATCALYDIALETGILDFKELLNLQAGGNVL